MNSKPEQMLQAIGLIRCEKGIPDLQVSGNQSTFRIDARTIYHFNTLHFIATIVFINSLASFITL